MTSLRKTEESDHVLIRRFVDDQDAGAFESLVRRYERLVWNTCSSTLNCVHDAADAFQATFIALARKAETIRPLPTIAGWIRCVAHAESVNICRKRRAIRTLPDDIEDASQWRATERLEVAEDLSQAISRLPNRYRDVIALRYFDGLSRSEIASRLQISIDSVRGLLFRSTRDLELILRRREAMHLTIEPPGHGQEDSRFLERLRKATVFAAFPAPDSAPLGALSSKYNGLHSSAWFANTKAVSIFTAVCCHVILLGFFGSFPSHRDLLPPMSVPISVAQPIESVQSPASEADKRVSIAKTGQEELTVNSLKYNGSCVVGTTSCPHAIIEVDINDDGMADEYVIPGRNGKFNFDVRPLLPPGSNTIRVRLVNPGVATGKWVSITFDVDDGRNIVQQSISPHYGPSLLNGTNSASRPHLKHSERFTRTVPL